MCLKEVRKQTKIIMLVIKTSILQAKRPIKRNENEKKKQERQNETCSLSCTSNGCEPTAAPLAVHYENDLYYVQSARNQTKQFCYYNTAFPLLLWNLTST